MSKAFDDIKQERQDQQWDRKGDSAFSLHEWLTVIDMYKGNAATAAFSGGDIDWFRRNMVKIAAAAMAAIETIDDLRKRELEPPSLV